VAPDTRKTFHGQLDDIREQLVRLGALATELIPRGTEMLLNLDLREAQAIIDEDDEIDLLALDIEERCYRLLALQQPMAVDLRALVTAIRLASEIERSADLMVNVAKAVRRLYGMEHDPRVRGLLQRMGEEAHRLFRLAIDSYVDADEPLAAALDDMDDGLDTTHREFISQILESCRAGTIEVEAAVQLALIGRYYERIGDHAVNMGERVRYLVTGWLPEHSRVVVVDEVEPGSAS
jgi:phosphate transport system protein